VPRDFFRRQLPDETRVAAEFSKATDTTSGNMKLSQNKQEKKKKDRERRVAQKKVADARRLAAEQAAKEAQTASKVSRVFDASLTGAVEKAPPQTSETSTLRPGVK